MWYNLHIWDMLLKQELILTIEKLRNSVGEWLQIPVKESGVIRPPKTEYIGAYIF